MKKTTRLRSVLRWLREVFSAAMNSPGAARADHPPSMHRVDGSTPLMR